MESECANFSQLRNEVGTQEQEFSLPYQAFYARFPMSRLASHQLSRLQ